MNCPLSFNHIELPCRKENCGWWNKKGDECSVATIAKNGMEKPKFTGIQYKTKKDKI
jgi:hypothetical protein